MVIEDDDDGARWVPVVSGWVCATAVRNRGRRETPGGLFWLLGQKGGAGPFLIL